MMESAEHTIRLGFLEAIADGRVRVQGMCPVYPDEHIEFWGNVYLGTPELRLRGILFSTFLAYPEACLKAVNVRHDPYAPLLPAQQAIQRDIDREAEINRQVGVLESLLEQRQMRVSDGVAIEPLHHHAWPRRKHRRSPVERGND